MIRLGKRNILDLHLLDERVVQPLELEDGRPPGLRSATLHIISFATIAIIVWAAVAEVQEVARATGELVPAGKIQAVQHLEGGIVEQVYIKPDSDVKAGTPIVSLIPRLVSSDVGQFRGRMSWLELEEARLRAELAQERPDFSAHAAAYPELVKRQEAAWRAHIDERTKTFAALDARIAALTAQQNALVSENEKRQAEIDTFREIFGMQEQLAKKAHASRHALLEAKVAYQRSVTALAASTVQLAEVKKDLADAIGEKDTAGAKIEKEIADQRAQNIAQRTELAHQIDKLSDRLDRLLVRAPVDGFVQDVVPKGPGAVIQPGQLIAEIVPKDEPLVAEVMIEPRDVGHIKAGDPAELEVTTYDVNVQGKIKGKVTSVSASSFKTPSGAAYFRGEIAFDLAAQDEPIGKSRLTPGMVVEANIITGSKSIVRYLLKPIYRSLDRAFTER